MTRPTTLAPCPVGRMTQLHLADESTYQCPTMLQPYRGRLTEGVAAHLGTIHQFPEPAARSVATAWVKAGCRATG